MPGKSMYKLDCIRNFTCLQAFDIFEKCSNVRAALQDLDVSGNKGLKGIR